MKKSGCIMLILLLALMLSGCGENGKTEHTTALSTSAETHTEPLASASRLTAFVNPEETRDILDPQGQKLGAISRNAALTAAGSGIFYRILAQEENAPTGTAQYRFFRRADGSDILLGTLEDQGYETLYARTELEGIIYTLALTGNPLDDKPDTLWLLAADGAAGTLKKTAVSRTGHPYAALAAAGDRLYIMNHEMTTPACDKIYTFEPASGEVRELLSFHNTEEISLRSVCPAENGFYLLRLNPGAGQPELFLDRYDSAGRKLAEKPLNSLFLPAMEKINGIITEADAKNELGIMVSRFAVEQDRYLYYENFAITRLLIDLTNEEALFAESDLYMLSSGGGAPVFYQINFPGDEVEKAQIFELREGELKALPFTSPEDLYYIQSLSHSPAGTWLAHVTDRSGKTEALLLWTQP